MRGGIERLRGTLTAFLVVVIGIIVVFLAQITLEIRSELGEVKTSLTTMRTDLMRPAAAEPFAIIESKCVTCHNERRFLGVHGTSSELKQILDRMAKTPGAHVSAQERDKIHASLTLLRCLQCHGEDQGLKKLAAMGSEQRRKVIQAMADKPGSGIPPEEAEDILRAYREIQGF